VSAFNLSALAVRERSITLFLIIAISLAGAFAFLRLGRAEDPAFTIKVLTVTAAWPGATAQEMQDLVADPLEKRLQELSWYDRVETFMRPGLMLMTLTLKDSTPPADVPEQFYQARKKLGDETRNLPVGVFGPFVNDEYSDVDFEVYALEGHGLPERLLVRQAETLREQLLHVPGVKKVDIAGERPERIFVDFSYPRLATLGVTARDIFAALQNQNAIIPGGSIDTEGPQVFIRLDGALNDVQRIEDTPIVAGGHILRLGDIASVTRGYEDPPTYLIRHNGAPALVLKVVMRDGWNGLSLGRSLDAAEKTLGAELPASVTLTKISDQAVNIHDAVDEFMLKFFVALGVVMAVSLLALGWRVGIIVAAAVPLTLASVFVIMLITGRVFDRITLGALIIALGLLVDDAIIAIEIMVVKLEEGYRRADAAAYAWSHTAAPMLSGTIITIIGFTPVGFARSTAGEYAGNIFWVVGFALIASWIVAVVFTPYLGVALLPEIKKVEGAAAAIYGTPLYRRFRWIVAWSVRRKRMVALVVVAAFLVAGGGMAVVKKQFFPGSDRPEVLVEVQMPEGSSIESTSAAAAKVEAWLKRQPEAETTTSYIGAGGPRFFFSYNPELPDPSFAKLVVLTPDSAARDRLKLRLRDAIALGLAPEARVRALQLVFGPPSPFPVAFRVKGPDPDMLRGIADRVQTVMRENPDTRQVNQDWGERAPTLHFVLDQARLQLIGLSPAEVATQLQVLLTGSPVTQVREDIRTVDLIARSAGPDRLDPSRIDDLAVTSRDGKPVPLGQLGHVEVRMEDPILRRRDRIPTITVRSDIDERLQPPEVSAELQRALRPVMATLPPGYHIETAGSIEESDKANKALLPVLAVMLLLTFTVIVFQVRSLSAMVMVFLTSPLGLIGVLPTLLLFHQPFGFNAILGLIGLSGILMRNTLILIGQIHTNERNGLDPYHAVVEATVQRARPVVLTALAAMFAFVPLTQSVFFGAMAYTLIGGTAAGTVLILVFLPALYSIWFGIRSPEARAATAAQQAPAIREAMLRGPIMPTMLRLAAPMVVVLLVQTGIGVAETFYVSFLGTDALAGVALVFPVLMLMTMMSNGGIGGGVASAVARAIGAGAQEDADAITFHAAVLAILFGAAFTAAALALGPLLYRSLGGSGDALAAALTYSAFTFVGAIATWLVSLMAAALRGAGNVRVPALVVLAGAAIVVLLSPALIFGIGPLPKLGVGGAGAAVALYYLGATVALVRYLASGRGGLRLRRVKLQRRFFRAILGVGLLSAIGPVQPNLTVVLVTGAVGLFGADAIAGYGLASRLEYLMIPLLFGLGTAVVTMVGTNVGAGNPERARRIAWIGAAIGAAITEAIGVLVAIFPHAWLGLFSNDPEALRTGSLYLRLVGPTYGAVGLGMILYFASQGAGRPLLPVLAGTLRLAVAAGLGWLAVSRFDAGLGTLFGIVALSALLFGAANAAFSMARAAGRTTEAPREAGRAPAIEGARR